jgi:hypothetical protein
MILPNKQPTRSRPSAFAVNFEVEHEEAGSSKGGQFKPKSGGGGGDKKRDPVDQPDRDYHSSGDKRVLENRRKKRDEAKKKSSGKSPAKEARYKELQTKMREASSNKRLSRDAYKKLYEESDALESEGYGPMGDKGAKTAKPDSATPKKESAGGSSKTPDQPSVNKGLRQNGEHGIEDKGSHWEVTMPDGQKSAVDKGDNDDFDQSMDIGHVLTGSMDPPDGVMTQVEEAMTSGGGSVGRNLTDKEKDDVRQSIDRNANNGWDVARKLQKQKAAKRDK